MHFTCSVRISKTNFKSEITNKQTPVRAAQMSASITLSLSIHKPTLVQFLFSSACDKITRREFLGFRRDSVAILVLLGYFDPFRHHYAGQQTYSDVALYLRRQMTTKTPLLCVFVIRLMLKKEDEGGGVLG